MSYLIQHDERTNPGIRSGADAAWSQSTPTAIQPGVRRCLLAQWRLWTAVITFALAMPMAARAQQLYEYEVDQGEVTIAIYNSWMVPPGGHVTIPDTLGGFPVTRIGNWAFYYAGMASVTIPDGVTAIEESAFEGCTITSVDLPAGLATIGAGAFSDTALTSVTIPAGVTSIGAGSFARCERLRRLVVDPANAAYTSVDGVLFDAGQTLLLQYPAGTADAQYAIPAGVQSIGDQAFSGCVGLTGVTIPDGVTSIGDSAFIFCDSLAELTIPDSVTSIGVSAFSFCDSLAELTIPDSVTSIGGGAFGYCDSLSSAVIGGGVTAVGPLAFAYCPVLADVTLPEGLTAISEGMFRDCGLLYNPVIPTTVTSIGANAFRDCDGITAITLPAGVAAIGNEAFRGCDSLERVTLTEGLAEIGERAFSECSLLSDITIPSTVTTIGARAFLQSPKLASIEIPGSVGSIGEYAFSGCRGLTQVVVGEPIATVSAYLFENCVSLTDVTLPDSLETIEEGAFQSCSNLTSIVFNEGLSTIGLRAFSGSGLTSIHIPAGITMANYAFDGCLDLAAIEVDPANPVYASVDGVLFSKYGSVLLQYPAGRLSGQFVHYTIPETVTTIGAVAFRFVDNLLSVSIPASVAELETFAFDACLNLQRVYFGGDAPSAVGMNFFRGTDATLYYLPGTAGWAETWQGRATVQWDPRILPDPGTFGIHGGHFGYTLSAAAQVPVVIEACSDPAVGDWTVIDAVVCDADGIARFSDPDAADAPSRIYRFRPE